MALKKKLQVFVSSPYLDLEAERQAAVQAILTAGHIPAGMELFTAGDESQMDVIKQWIDESDVYMLILGARYGSVEPTSGKSYTHLEFEYAIAQGKPLFSVVIKEDCIDDRVKLKGKDVLELHHPDKLKTFREDVTQSRLVAFWRDARDVEIAVYKTLKKYEGRDDLIGWIPGNSAIDTGAVTAEMARLNKENADLHNAVRVLKKQGEQLLILKKENERRAHGAEKTVKLLDSDSTILLRQHLSSRPSDRSGKRVIVFAEADKALRFPDGTAKRCLGGALAQTEWKLTDMGETMAEFGPRYLATP